MEIQTSKNVTSLYFDVAAGWEQWILLMSDNHHDSPHCNRDLELQHLQQAQRTGALIFLLGDLFDAMQGRYDPRRAYSDLREEYRCENYFDALINDFADFYAPYAPQMVLMARGNHESAALKNNNTDLIDRLVRELNQRTGARIQPGGYGGWVRFMFTHSGGIPNGSLKMKYFHGAGGEAPVTRGVIQTNRQAVYLPDADIVVNGHNHNSYYVPITRERISNKGVLFMDTQHHIRIPGYKQDYRDGSGGWEVERGGVPKPIGCAWVHLWEDSKNIRLQVIPDVSSPTIELA